MSANPLNANHGGEMVSVPVWWFRNGPFKDKFSSHPKETYLVHYVVLSDQTVGDHYLALYGTEHGDVQCNEETFEQFHAYWLDHGEPMVPPYQLAGTEDAFEVIDLAPKTPAKKKRRSSDGRSAKSTRSKSLLDAHPNLSQDWQGIALDRGDLGLRLKVPLGLYVEPPDTTSYQYGSTLILVVDRLLLYRDPWSYESNSCHMDTWLLVELALYDTLASRGHLCDGLILSSPRLYRLFKVLLAVGTTNQNNMRHSYWAMEIEDWRGPSSRREFKKNSDYDIHRELVYSKKATPAAQAISTLGLSRNVSCSSPEHDDEVVHMNIRTIVAPKAWYSMPADNTRRQVEINGELQWRMPAVVQHNHTGPADVLATVVARSDSKLVPCKQCTHGVVETTKLPQRARLPVTLAFNVHQSRLPIQVQFDFGGVGYSLIGIVFGNGAHFICNVKIRGLWYQYDDMGIRGKGTPPPNSRVPNPPRLVQATGSYLVPSSPKGYTPSTVRYLRDETETLDTVPIRNPATVPNQQQFHEFRILHDEHEEGQEFPIDEHPAPTTAEPRTSPRKRKRNS